MGTSPSIQQCINVFRPELTDLTWPGALGNYPPHKAVIQLTKHKELSDAFVFSGAPLFEKGEWFIDCRYRLLDDIDLDALPKAPDDKITVYKVGSLPNDPKERDRTTFPEDESTTHGGLYYVGYQALRLLIAYKNRKLLCEKLMTPVDKVATTRRYKYPAVILRSEHESIGAAKSLARSLTSAYSRWGLEVHLLTSPGSIREGHAKVLEYARHGGSVLAIDADFIPNSNPALMYEPRGDETKYVHLWHTKNDVNAAVYGHGSPKLLSRSSFDLSREGEDMTMSCAVHGITVHPEVVGVHDFCFEADKLARTTVREVHKLSKAARAGDKEAKERLAMWATPSPLLKEEKYAAYVMAVAAGLKAEEYRVPINDFDAVTKYLNEFKETHECHGLNLQTLLA